MPDGKYSGVIVCGEIEYAVTLSSDPQEYLLTFSAPSEMTLYSYRMQADVTNGTDGTTVRKNANDCVLICGSLELPSSEKSIPALLFSCLTLTEREMTSVSHGNIDGREADIMVFACGGNTVTVYTDGNGSVPFRIRMQDAGGTAIFDFAIDSYTP